MASPKRLHYYLICSRTLLLDGIVPAVEKRGFTLKRNECEIVRKASEISQIFWVNVHQWTGWIGVTPEVYIGCPKIIRQFNAILDRKLRADDFVCGFGIRNKFHGRGNYRVEAPADIEQLRSQLISDFEEIALPFFSKFDGIESIDKYMNSPSDDGQYKPESVGRACMGLIAAKLTGNPAFQRLVDSYFKFCAESQGEKIAQQILRIRAHFEARSV